MKLDWAFLRFDLLTIQETCYDRKIKRKLG